MVEGGGMVATSVFISKMPVQGGENGISRIIKNGLAIAQSEGVHRWGFAQMWTKLQEQQLNRGTLASCEMVAIAHNIFSFIHYFNVRSHVVLEHARFERTQHI